jgi:hypothetical protein
MVCRLQNRPHFRGLAKIPCEIESGIFCREPGHFRQANGKFSQRQLEGAPFANVLGIYAAQTLVLAIESRATCKTSRLPDLEGFAVPFICE